MAVGDGLFGTDDVDVLFGKRGNEEAPGAAALAFVLKVVGYSGGSDSGSLTLEELSYCVLEFYCLVEFSFV